MTCPSTEWTRALRHRLLTPVKVSSDPPVHSRGGYAAWAATPVCLLSLRDIFVNAFFASSSCKQIWIQASFVALSCPFSGAAYFCDGVHEVSELQSAGWGRGGVMSDTLPSICSYSRDASEHLTPELSCAAAAQMTWCSTTSEGSRGN